MFLKLVFNPSYHHSPCEIIFFGKYFERQNYFIFLPMWRLHFMTSNTQSNKTMIGFWNLIDAFCAFLWIICLFWDCDTGMTVVSISWLFYPIKSVLFTHCCKYNRIWCDYYTSERFGAIKSDSIHHLLQLKMPVPSQQQLLSIRLICFIIWFCHLM